MNLTDKQRVFLQQYDGLLQEVEEAAKYAGECYVQGDEDIGSRLLASVSTGLIPYNPDNMTLASIFLDDSEAMNMLARHYETILTASETDNETQSIREKMQFLHETFIPVLHQWHLVVKKYVENGGNNHATH